jgi:hypothetical protein
LSESRELRRKILDLVDNMGQMNKAAFYSDPYVERLVEELHTRWAQNSYQGEPIDYSSDEEAEKLYALAKRYASMPSWEAYKLFIKRVEGEEQ